MTWDELSESEKGYVAGFLDGEGSICIYKHKTIHYCLSIAFYNSHKGVIDWIEGKLGYKSFKRTTDNRLNDRHNKNNYVVYIRKNSDSLDFLKKCLPYLIIKKDQAKNAILFLESVLNREDYKYTEKLINTLEKYSVINKNLNKGWLD
jgi:hypothetical protein